MTAGHTAGHRIIASLSHAQVGPMLAAVGDLPQGVTDAEIRLDSLWPGPPDPETAADAVLALVDSAQAAHVRLIATLRPVRQGGGFVGDEQVRVGLLAAAAQAGFAAIDLEADVAAPLLVGELRRTGAQVNVTQHHIGPTPCRDDGLSALTLAQDAGGNLDKFVFSGHSYVDVLRALELASGHAARGGRPALGVPGVGGPELRALLAIAGNQATYGHAPGLEPATPGQPAIADVLDVWRRWGLTPADLDPVATGARPWLAVLGTPVGHSLSPLIQNAALRAAGRPERFGVLEVPASPGALLLTFHAATRIGLAGASVTTPHKRDAARVTTGDAVVTATGAANTIRFSPAGAQSTNTDATALRRMLAPHIDAGAPAVVLGAGGLARAAIWALRDLGAAVRFASRDPAHGAALAQTSGAKWTPWDQRDELRAPVWVQATTLGRGANDPNPIAPAQLRGAVLAVEANYAAGPTAFEQAARSSGAAILNGQSLLVEQAADAFAFWFGRAPDRAAMEHAAGIATVEART